jgi:hypothetical protein
MSCYSTYHISHSEQPCKDSKSVTVRKGQPVRTAGTGKPGQYSHDRTARTVQSGQGFLNRSRDRKDKTGGAENESKEWTAVTGKPSKRVVVQDFLDRSAGT